MASTTQDEFKLDIPCCEVESIGSRVRVPCHLFPEISAVSMEIRWFKETDCVCLYNNGQVTEGRGFEGRVSLFIEELERGDVSLQLRDCKESDTGHYLCQVTNGNRTEEVMVVVQMLGDKYGLIHKLVKVEREWTREERMKMDDSVLLTVFKTSSMFELLQRNIEQKNRERENMLQQLKDLKIALEDLRKELDCLTLKYEIMSVEKDQKISDLDAELKTLKNTDTYPENIQTTDSTEASDLDQRTDNTDSATDQVVTTNHPMNVLLSSEEHVSHSDCIIVNRDTSDSAVPVRRRNSIDKVYPHMGGESSSPDSTVPVPVPELRLVLLGRTGSGKTAAGNTILGREERNQAGTSTESEKSESRQGEVAGRKVTVVDTPDWFCPEHSLEEVRQDVGLCVRLSAPGPHAFLLVIPVKQDAGEEKGMLEKMEELFWESCWRNTLVLFTVTDEQQEKITKELIQSGNQEVKRLVEKSGYRFHCLNIKDNGDGSQVSELLEKIEEMVLGNKEKFYSSEIYHEIRKMEERIIKEREENKEREIRQCREAQEKDVQKRLKSITEQIQYLERKLHEHEEQISKLEVQIKEVRNKDRITKLEMELKQEIQEKEATEQQLNELMELRAKERLEMEEKHRQEMEKIIEMYEGEARMETERNLMKIVLPELHRTVWVIISMVQKEFLVKLEKKDSELLTMKQRLCELTEHSRQLEEDYQSALRRMEDVEAKQGEWRDSKMAFGEGEEVEQRQDKVEAISVEGQQIEDEERGPGKREDGGAEERGTGARWWVRWASILCCSRPQGDSEETVPMKGEEL